MKKLLIGLTLLISASSFATTVVMDKWLVGTSLRNCAHANLKLSNSIESLRTQKEIKKIKIEKCNKTSMGSTGFTSFVQKAKVELLVERVNGNF